MELQELQDKLQETITDKLAPLKAELGKSITKEELEVVNATIKSEIEKMEKAHKDLNEKLYQQGKTIVASKNESLKVEQKAILNIQEEYLKQVSSQSFLEGNSTIRVKAIEGLVHTLDDVLDDKGDVVSVGTSQETQNWFAQKIEEIATKPLQDVSWFNSLNVMPLIGNRLTMVEMCSDEVNIQCVGECEIKPLSKVTPQVSSADACVIPAKWKLTRQYRKVFKALEGLIRTYFERLIFIEIQQEIFTRLFANGSTYQNLSGASYTNPNIVNVINEMITEMQTLNAEATTLFLNPITSNIIRNIEDGQQRLKYQCCNGEMNMFNTPLNVVVRNFVPAGEIMLGDLTKAYIAVGDDVEFVQAYTGDDLDRNCITNRLETDLAVLVPECHQAYFMTVNIEDGKAQLTA